MKIFLLISCFAFSAWASAPVNGCRVKADVLKKHGTVLNNAGCIITRPKHSETEFLMVYVDKVGGDSGWGFPGGKPASKKNDLDPKDPSGHSIAKAVDFDYVEPAVCTASRETREETGLEVVVGDLISDSPTFMAFRCHTPEVSEQLKAQDVGEIKDLKWISYSDLKDGKFPLRFKSNLDIVEKENDFLRK